MYRKSAYDSLHVVENRKTKKKVIPGWNESIKPFREKALFWNQVWKSAGKPINTNLHEIMKRTRNIYHFQIKKCKKAESNIKMNKLLDACLNGGGDVFKEIEKIRRCENVVTSSIDGVHEHVEEHFKEK